MPNVLSLLDTRTLGYGICRNDGKIYNFTSQGWDALPSNGVPTQNQYQALTRFSTTGPLNHQWSIALPDVVSATDGMWAPIFSLDSSGNIIEQIDLLPSPYLNYVWGTRGGWLRR
jgi:hypothetical protein